MGIRLGIGPELFAKLLGWLSFLSILLLLDLGGPESTDLVHRRVMLVQQFTCAGMAALVFWSCGGLETLPYTLCLWILIHLVVGGSPGCMIVGLCLATLRPEGTAVALAAVGIAAVSQKKLLPSWVGLCGLLTLYHLARWQYFGQLLPQAYWAKNLARASHGVPGWIYLGNFLLEAVPSTVLIGCIVALVRPRGSWVRSVTLIACVQVLPIFSVGGDWMPMHRLLVPILPLMLAVSADGLVTLYQAMGPRDAVGRFTVLIFMAFSFFQGIRIPPGEELHIEYQNRLGDLMHQAVQVLNEQEGPVGADPARRPSVAVGDIGRIGYRSGWRILDLKGLVTPDAVRGFRLNPKNGAAFPDPGWMFEAGPEWILLAIDSDGTGVWATDRACLRDPRLTDGYEPVADVSIRDLPVIYRLFRAKAHVPRRKSEEIPGA